MLIPPFLTSVGQHNVAMETQFVVGDVALKVAWRQGKNVEMCCISQSRGYNSAV